MKRATIRDIAERCGVSPTVVSAVLNRPFARSRCSKEKCELIRKTAKEMDYHPNVLARAMVSQQVPVVALMLYSSGERQNYRSDYLSETVPTFVHAVEDLQMEVIVVFYRDEEEQLRRFEALRNKGMIGGVASNLIPSSHHRILEAFHNSGLPCVVLGHTGEPTLNIRFGDYYSFVPEYHAKFGTKRCYLMLEEDEKPVLYPYENVEFFDRFNHSPIPATDRITADPENLILILGAEFYLRSPRKFAHPLIVETENYEYLIPPGIHYAVYSRYNGICERKAAMMLSEWMKGNPPEKREYRFQGNHLLRCSFKEINAQKGLGMKKR